jgi:hypothetical protein
MIYELSKTADMRVILVTRCSQHRRPGAAHPATLVGILLQRHM